MAGEFPKFDKLPYVSRYKYNYVTESIHLYKI